MYNMKSPIQTIFLPFKLSAAFPTQRRASELEIRDREVNRFSMEKDTKLKLSAVGVSTTLEVEELDA
jgi:hypothetical protein